MLLRIRKRSLRTEIKIRKTSGNISHKKDENNVINNNYINKNKNLEGINGSDQNSLTPDILIMVTIKTAQTMIHRSKMVTDPR